MLWGFGQPQGSRKKETMARTLEWLPQAMASQPLGAAATAPRPTSTAIPQVYYIPKPREPSRTR